MHTLGNVVWAVRSQDRAVVPLLIAYGSLKAGELTSRHSSSGLRRARFLGFDVRFFDHYWLVEMYEEIFLRDQYFFAAGSESPLVVDVGSNIGLSVLYFKRLYPRARIHAFEPDPLTFRVLEANVRANRLDDVVLVNEAASDREEPLQFYRDPRTPGSPQQSSRSGRFRGVATRVAASRLSDRITEPVDFLKLDVEGAERRILAELDGSGALGLVHELAVEVHHHFEGDEDVLGDILSLLERNGFGYQLEARLGGRPGRREPQNILVRAYSKRDDR